jgi:hypothetical protein
MKKATNPLALDLRAGGFEVFPIAKLFDLPSNVWYPSILIRENMLAEPFAAWAANVFYTLGGLQVLQWSDAAFFYTPTSNWLRPHHFAQRLTPAKVHAIISRVIRNAESVNADPSRDFIIESLGIFGSVLTAGATSPGDVDVVFTARWRSNNRPLPEASYYPFGVSEPTSRVSSALSRGSRKMDLSSHYLLEIERLGAPYRIIWTREQGCVDRPIITPKKRRSKEYVSADELPGANAFTDSFRARCASLPPLLPPRAPFLPQPTRQMSHSEWLAVLDDKHPVVDLAHSLCLPRGELKEKISSMMAERFQMHSGLKAEARKMLHSYLAASALYGEWRWEPAIGLRRTKRRAAAPLK